MMFFSSFYTMFAIMSVLRHCFCYLATGFSCYFWFLARVSASRSNFFRVLVLNLEKIKLVIWMQLLDTGTTTEDIIFACRIQADYV